MLALICWQWTSLLIIFISIKHRTIQLNSFLFASAATTTLFTVINIIIIIIEICVFDFLLLSSNDKMMMMHVLGHGKWWLISNSHCRERWLARCDSRSLFLSFSLSNKYVWFPNYCFRPIDNRLDFFFLFINFFHEINNWLWGNLRCIRRNQWRSTYAGYFHVTIISNAEFIIDSGMKTYEQIVYWCVIWNVMRIWLSVHRLNEEKIALFGRGKGRALI